ncbi:transcriptional regulator [Flavobacterium sp. PLA-1-15]|uniref:transcriptional regulator n=1 Tax=Flavobacterium sp. PLA-1-15 TaxID=3380533 RepID=UPI003B7727D2
MKDTSQKYLKEEANDCQHVGNFVHWFIKLGHHKKKDVAGHLKVVPTTLNSYFKQQSLQFAIVWRISQAINYNLVMDLGQRLKIPFETEIEKELRKQLAEKEEIIKRMEIQLEVLRERRG